MEETGERQGGWRSRCADRLREGRRKLGPGEAAPAQDTQVPSQVGGLSVWIFRGCFSSPHSGGQGLVKGKAVGV